MKRTKGFTLIELVAVFAIMVILVTVGTISLSGSLSKNTKKTIELKSGNILRSVEDYVVKNKIVVPQAAPLYFSVSALTEQDILTEDANQIVAESLGKSENNTFYVEAIKDAQGIISYRFLTSTELSNKVSVTNDEVTMHWVTYNAINYDTKITQINLEEREDGKVKFVLKSNTALVYSTYIESLDYVIKNATETVTIKASTKASDLVMNKDGSYTFTVANNLPRGTYKLIVSIQTDLSKISDDKNDSVLNNNNSPLTINVLGQRQDPVACTVTIPTSCNDKWHNGSSCNIVVLGESEQMATSADKISYTIKKYVSNDGNSNYQTPDVAGELTLSNGQGTLASSNFSTDGYYKINFKCEVADNPNYAATETNTVVRTDTTAPTFTVTGNPTTWQKTAATLSPVVSSSSISNLPALAYSYDTDPSATDNSGTTWTSSTTHSYSVNGAYTIAVKDNAGNVRKVTTNITYIDVTGPAVPTWSVTTPSGAYTNNTWTGSDVTWNNFSASDTQSGVDHYEYSTGCTFTNWATLGSSYTYPLGTNNYWNSSYCIRAIDNVGNASAASSQLYIKVDQEAPVMTLFDLRQVVSGSCTGALANNTWTNDNVCILPPPNYSTIAATDGYSGINRYQISSDNVTFYNMMTVWDSGNSWNYITTQGTHYRYIRAVDNVGNVSSSIGRTIKIDKTAPSVSAVKSSTTASGTNCVAAIYWIKMTTSDNLSKTKLTGSYRYSNSDWGTIGGGYTYTFGCNTSAADDRVYMDMNPSSFRSADSYYIKLQGYDGSRKTRVYLNVVDEAGNSFTIYEPSSTTWFE